MNQTNNSAENALVKKKSKLSAIWALPILAGVIGLWLVIQAMMTAGIDITVQFNSGNGIVVGKTEVRFKGLTIGTVKDVELNKDLESVTATIEMHHSTKPYLTPETLFWLVSPEISLSGVSGLDTVISGNYIRMAPAQEKGKLQTKYVALKHPAPASKDTPGLHLTLHSDTLGSIGLGSKIYYKKVEVGEVVDYKLDDADDRIAIQVLIQEEYAHLVKNTSRFWNASGITVSGDLSGFKLQTEALGSIIAGGIAFHNTDDPDAEDADNHSNFLLYPSADDAKAWVEVMLHFPQESSVSAGQTKVQFANHEIGYVEKVSYDKEREGGWIAKVMFDPRVKPYLTESAEFWMDSPSISLAKMDSFKSILLGPFIGFKLGEASSKPLFEFDVAEQRPAKDYDEPGLHVNLITRNLNSVSDGAGIFYRKMRVGYIERFKLSEDSKHFNVHAIIEEKYSYLVNDSTVFFEDSGVEFSGNLQAFTFKSRPVEAMLSGGISFHTKDISREDIAADGTEFKLYKSRKDARYTETAYVTVKDDTDVTIDMTRLMHLGDEIGIVTGLDTSADFKSLKATIKYNPKFRDLFRKDSAIWMVSPSISAGSVAGLDALVGGSYLMVKAGKGDLAKEFVLAENAPASIASDPGLQIKLSTKDASSVSVGAPITYLKREIGQIETVLFKPDGSGVDVAASIDEKYRHYVRQDSRFYLAGGIQISGTLTNMNIRTESVASIIRGGIALYNDDTSDEAEAAELQHFSLFQNHQSAALNGHNVKLTFDRVISLTEGAPVKYSDRTIGTVMKVNISDDLDSTSVELSISKHYKALYADDAKFWLASAEIGLAKVKNPGAILTGNFIGVIPGESNSAGSSFTGMLYEPPVKSLANGLNIRFRTERLGSIKSGNPIYYRQIKVGEVLGYELSSDSNSIVIYANISKTHQHLVNNGSRFWNASGVDVDAGVFSGVAVSTESVEALLSGGIAFASPSDGQPVSNNAVEFPLYEEGRDEWLEWKVSP